jgi:glycosyltransferase involved in cell wall biosynthesis
MPVGPALNVLFVSHCALDQNSGLQIAGLAAALRQLGVVSLAVLPDRSVIDPLSGARSRLAEVTGGRRPDLIHAWTPREPVRRLVEELRATFPVPYLVHLEDNERLLLATRLADSPGGGATAADLVDPERDGEFLARSRGVTVLTDALARFVPPGVAIQRFWPGFSPALAVVPQRTERFRAELGLRPDEAVIVYCGNVHAANREDVGSLYRAVGLVAARGRPIRLVRTGIGEPAALCDPALVIRLGWVPRPWIRWLLALADLHVQPGSAGPFNDYRLASKLPELLVSGRPVILPRANLALALRHDRDAVIMDRGDAAEVAAQIERLLDHLPLARAIGRRGRAFALSSLDWACAARVVAGFYRNCLSPGATLARKPRRQGSWDGR